MPGRCSAEFPALLPRTRLSFPARSESARYCAPIQYGCFSPSLNEVPSHAEGMAGDPGADSPVGAVSLLCRIPWPGTYSAKDRMLVMGRTTQVSIVHRRALNQAMIYASHVPERAVIDPSHMARALRSALRMSQEQLARRCGLPRAHIARLEAGAVDVRLATMRRIFAAMFCDMLVLPRPRQRPSEALAARRLEQLVGLNAWSGVLPPRNCLALPACAAPRRTP